MLDAAICDEPMSLTARWKLRINMIEYTIIPIECRIKAVIFVISSTGGLLNGRRKLYWIHKVRGRPRF
jgi:hypothetical protein